MEKAYFAGGCFWCITPTFRQLDGVHRVISGYSGGQEVDPTYEDVKHQRTGHRECICIEYDQRCTTYEALLKIFLESVDLFDGGGQFIDRGFSYTLAVYYSREEERKTALHLLQQAQLQAQARELAQREQRQSLEQVPQMGEPAPEQVQDAQKQATIIVSPSSGGWMTLTLRPASSY